MSEAEKYCPYWDWCAKGIKCDRALTKEIKDEARRNRENLEYHVSPPVCFIFQQKETLK